MATYMALVRFTQKGATEAEFSPKRAEEFKKAVEKAGGKVRELLWFMGRYDGAALFEAPNDETAAALSLALTAHGCVHTETLRAFSAKEFATVVQKSK